MNNDDALIDLQTQVAFQENTIEELNAALVVQQRQLDVLRLEMRLLQEKLGSLEDRMERGGGSPRDEKPPHY